ncbi:unnamed protein product, partial [Rotaria sp. Silwood2]
MQAEQDKEKFKRYAEQLQNELADSLSKQIKAEQEKIKAEKDKEKAEQDKKKADQEKEKAEAERRKAEEDKVKTEQDKKKADQEKEKAEAEKRKAEQDVKHLQKELDNRKDGENSSLVKTIYLSKLSKNLAKSQTPKKRSTKVHYKCQYPGCHNGCVSKTDDCDCDKLITRNWGNGGGSNYYYDEGAGGDYSFLVLCGYCEGCGHRSYSDGDGSDPNFT